MANLADLENCIGKAEANAAQERAMGGKRPDAGLHELLLSVGELYDRSAARPRRPSGWSADAESDEFLHLVQAIVGPLGVKKSDTELREIFRRALKASAWA